MSPKSKTILAAVEDLFFTVKIADSAKRAGLLAVFLKSEEELLARAVAERPLLIILDLNARSLQPVRLIESIKQTPELKGVPVISFVAHVQADLKQKAQDAGSTMVLARSAFSTNLPMLLKRHTTAMA